MTSMRVRTKRRRQPQGRQKRGRQRLAALVCGAVALAAALAAAGGGTAQAASCNPATGPYQRQAEQFLGRPADGRQSAADCRAIKAFQSAHGITPAAGYAGPLTWQTMSVMLAQRAAGSTPNRDGQCPTRLGRIACVDLTRQLSWVQDGAALRYGPVPVRTGKAATPTRTGLKQIYYRSIDHWSTLYDVAMPYAQFFDGGIAFHSVDKSMWNPPGSGGCVNMRPADAKAYWELLGKGDDVYVYGRKPGT